VRQHGRLVAFANLQVTACREEASVDLMRHRPEAPPGTMDFLFAKVMLHLQAEGYQWFGLGMSPLAGMAERAGTALAAAGPPAVQVRGPLLPLPRPAQLQGQVRTQLGSPLPGHARRAGPGVRWPTSRA
jgi:hypothetical protein